MSLTISQAFLLAVIQGLTEWLPVSSSGHLALAEMTMGVNVPLIFNLAVHLGTLGAVIWMLWEDVTKVLRAVPRLLSNILCGRSPPVPDIYARMAMYLLAATIPAAVAGYLLKGWAEEAFLSPLAFSAAFIFTGIFLLSTRGLRYKGGLNSKRGMVVGLAQIITIFPGISRSGITIGAGLHAGLSREEAARFSFLLSIPLIVGAVVFEAFSSPAGSALLPQLAVGIVVSFLVGAASIRFLMRLVKKGEMYLFAPYCLALGIGIMFWSIF
ncbi:MAG: undecaprenyl-diphosphate phosphatase [Thermoplasmata archaeon]|nr:undecaprenyl-diphosphate phosphatase [Thermoplasmata archaeon]